MVRTEIQKIALKFEPVGSRITCDPPPTNTDEDFLLLVANMFDGRFENDGWECETDSHYGDEDTTAFVSYRKDDVNLIVTDDEVFYEKFLLATHTAKKLNLLKKRDRITLFRAILYNGETR